MRVTEPPDHCDSQNASLECAGLHIGRVVMATQNMLAKFYALKCYCVAYCKLTMFSDLNKAPFLINLNEICLRPNTKLDQAGIEKGWLDGTK